jgi:hypothetical protein
MNILDAATLQILMVTTSPDYIRGGLDMNTTVYNSMKTELILGDYRFVRLLEDFTFYSTILGEWCTIPRGFVFDLESVPLLRGTNPESGGVHDYLCRIDSDPVVDKLTAAKVYFEFQGYFDEKESGNIFNRLWDWMRRTVKTGVVMLVPGYFHKYKVMATYEELA